MLIVSSQITNQEFSQNFFGGNDSYSIYTAEEIVRSLVRTIGLFLAVPFTMLLACWVVDDESRLARIFEPPINISDLNF